MKVSFVSRRKENSGEHWIRVSVLKDPVLEFTVHPLRFAEAIFDLKERRYRTLPSYLTKYLSKPTFGNWKLTLQFFCLINIMSLLPNKLVYLFAVFCFYRTTIC